MPSIGIGKLGPIWKIIFGFGVQTPDSINPISMLGRIPDTPTIHIGSYDGGTAAATAIVTPAAKRHNIAKKTPTAAYILKLFFGGNESMFCPPH
jgi:hypothetical protein